MSSPDAGGELSNHYAGRVEQTQNSTAYPPQWRSQIRASRSVSVWVSQNFLDGSEHLVSGNRFVAGIQSIAFGAQNHTMHPVAALRDESVQHGWSCSGLEKKHIPNSQIDKRNGGDSHQIAAANERSHAGPGDANAQVRAAAQDFFEQLPGRSVRTVLGPDGGDGVPAIWL